jgi:hypothetical protein
VLAAEPLVGLASLSVQEQHMLLKSSATRQSAAESELAS